MKRILYRYLWPFQAISASLHGLFSIYRYKRITFLIIISVFFAFLFLSLFVCFSTLLSSLRRLNSNHCVVLILDVLVWRRCSSSCLVCSVRSNSNNCTFSDLLRVFSSVQFVVDVSLPCLFKFNHLLESSFTCFWSFSTVLIEYQTAVIGNHVSALRTCSVLSSFYLLR